MKPKYKRQLFIYIMLVSLITSIIAGHFFVKYPDDVITVFAIWWVVYGIILVIGGKPQPIAKTRKQTSNTNVILIY